MRALAAWGRGLAPRPLSKLGPIAWRESRPTYFRFIDRVIQQTVLQREGDDPDLKVFAVCTPPLLSHPPPVPDEIGGAAFAPHSNSLT